mgnify:FL=1
MMNPLATTENLHSLVTARAGMKRATSTEEKLAALDKGLSEIVERIAPEMTKPKLTTAIATEMVDLIEKIKNDSDAAILAIYIDARDNYAGVNNDSVISDAVKARRDLREAEFMASSLLASFDAED